MSSDDFNYTPATQEEWQQLVAEEKRWIEQSSSDAARSYNAVFSPPDALREQADRDLEDDILKAVTGSRFLKANLSQIAKYNAVPVELVESIAQQLTQKHLGQDLEYLEYDSIVKQIEQIEQIQDAGLREWKLQVLARRAKRTSRQLMEVYNKALCQQQFFQPKHISEFQTQHQQEVEWLVQGWIPKGITLLLHAEGGVGKTLFLYEMMAAILQGKPWNGYPVTQSNVLLIQVDEPEMITAERIDIRGIPSNAPLWIESGWKVEAIAHFEAWCAKMPPGSTIIIDSLTAINRSCIFSENDTEYARPLLQINDIRKRYGHNVFIIHHSNGEGNARGSRAIHNSVDAVWSMTVGAESPSERLMRVQKTRMGLPPGRYKFVFDAEDFTFRYLGEDGEEENAEATATQAGRIRLWLSDDNQRGIAYAPAEISEYLNLGKEATRRALRELWAKGLIRRERIPGTPYYLYSVQDTDYRSGDQSESEVRSPSPIASKPPNSNGFEQSDQAIGQKTENKFVEKPKTVRSPDRFEDKPALQLGFEGDRASDRESDRAIAIENEQNLAVGDLVIAIGSATWLRSGSDKLPWKEVPKSKRSDPQIPINCLGEPLFRELMDGGKIIDVSRDRERVKVRNQQTGRTSIFPATDVRVLKRGDRL
ncbi:AAA family ATPase [Oculatella sp. LEGE 06141]|uniref:AAA family ATPase n=1 Tax=Oculatella sp. LEGE 06141 TaxID=1828648 RepID=UPI001881BD28|nr:AAA family ATPase [Oculatella sp. LEGE 06141]MBE9179126.1 AAA family ATPase [Oculatella sp. LEGE 06141]